MNENQENDEPAKPKLTGIKNEICFNEKKTSHSLSNVSNVFLPTRVRRCIQTDSRFDTFLLDYNMHFLLPISFIIYCLFLFVQIF